MSNPNAAIDIAESPYPAVAGGDDLPSPAAGVTLQLLGGRLASSLEFNLERDFSVVSRLADVSPFTVSAPSDSSMAAHGERKGSTPRSRLDALKNLRAVLDGARADYLVLDNSAAALPVASRGGSWYSFIESEKSSLMEAIRELPRRQVALPHELRSLESLLGNYDRFVETVLEAYSPDRIILIRSHASPFYWDGQRVRARAEGKGALRVSEMLEMLDERFQRATGCRVVDVSTEFLPTRDAAEGDLALGADFRVAAERAVMRLCGRAADTAPSHAPQPTSAFAQWAHRQVRSGRTVRPAMVHRRYSKTGGRTADDLAAVAALVAAAPDADWADLASALVDEANPAVASTRSFFERNRSVLLAHPHTYVEGVAALEFRSRVVRRLADGWYLDIDPEADRAISIRAFGRSAAWDPQRFVEQDYTCTLDEIEDALESWWAYFERGRRGDRSPFRIALAGLGELTDAMHLLDFADILSNENFCLSIGGELPPDIDWTARVDTSFLFDPRTRVCSLRSGLGDQLFYYVYARDLADRLDLRLFVDDLLYDNDEMLATTPHLRPDILPMIRSEGVFSEIFSRRLRAARCRDNTFRRDNRSEFHAFGLHEMVLATDKMHMKCCVDRNDLPTCLAVQVVSLDGMERLTRNPPGILFLDVLAKGGLLGYQLLTKKTLWERAIRLPEFVMPTSHAIAERMLSTDAIVVHIRRGDRVALGIADDDGYYRDFVQRTAALDHYADKHWFVFSDDLEYCRTHRTELGLDLAGDRITFVEGNDHYASIDDFRLMSLGKVVICGKSGFSACAAMISTRVEHIFGSGYSLERGGDSWHRDAAEPIATGA